MKAILNGNLTQNIWDIYRWCLFLSIISKTLCCAFKNRHKIVEEITNFVNNTNSNYIAMFELTPFCTYTFIDSQNNQICIQKTNKNKMKKKYEMKFPWIMSINSKL